MGFDWNIIFCNSSNDEELYLIFEDLNRIAPHINWQIGWRDHDLGPYSVLEVPNDNYDEAENIIERYEAGEDLTTYSYKDKYPNTFINCNGVRKINPCIINFYELAKEFVWMVDDFYNIELEDFINRIIPVLLKLYIAGRELRYDIFDFNPYQEEFSYEELDFGKYNIFFDIEYVYREKVVEEYKIKNIIDSIVDDIKSGVFKFKNAKPNVLAQIANEWGRAFRGTYGFGRGIIKLIKALHEVLELMEEEKYRKMLELRKKSKKLKM